MSTDKINVTIWGAGFVGATCYKAFISGDANVFKIKVFDTSGKDSKLGKEMPDANFVSKEEAFDSKLHIICVPTPMVKSIGRCNTSIVEGVVEEITDWGIQNGLLPEIVIKSTVPVRTSQNLADKLNARVIFNPEFLTEANAYEDFVNLPYQIIGMTHMFNPFKGLTLIETLYKSSSCFKNDIVFYRVNSVDAEFVKLMRNCYLATRISFFNEMKQFSENSEINFEKVTKLAGLDPRVGDHYNKVPGPDGKMGFSLSCLPKDLNSMIYEMKKLAIDPLVLQAVWDKNLEVRPEKDWEQLEKAVSK